MSTFKGVFTYHNNNLRTDWYSDRDGADAEEREFDFIRQIVCDRDGRPM